MIENLIFDLDDTLYPHSSKMGRSIYERIVSYSARFFGKTFGEIEKLRETELRKHVSTLAWMKAHGFSNEEDYFAWVHPESEISDLEFDPKLRPFLESLPMPKVILTNSPSEHAEHVLNFLGIRDLFCETISDIRRNSLLGKPSECSYRDALSIVGGTVEDTLFLDDYPPYALGFARIGGSAVIVGGAECEVPANLSGKVRRIASVYDLPELLGGI